MIVQAHLTALDILNHASFLCQGMFVQTEHMRRSHSSVGAAHIYFTTCIALDSLADTVMLA